MAVKYRKQYGSEAEYMYELAKTTGKFDETAYSLYQKTGDADNYAYAVAGTKTRTSDTFKQEEYDLLNPEDKLTYIMNEYYVDNKSTNYSENRKYLDAKIQEGIDKRTFENLNTFEKVAGTIGGFVGNALNEVTGIAESIIDVGIFAGEGVARLAGDEQLAEQFRELQLKDTTGYYGRRSDLNRFIRSSTYIDKSKVLTAVKDVQDAVVQMLPNILGYALAPVTGGVSVGIGNAIYYTSMAGRAATEEYLENPNADYGSLLLYTASAVALEAAVEGVSDKVFKGVTVIDKIKGANGAAIAGSTFKKLGLSAFTEGLEESVSEVCDTLLYNAIMSGDRKLDFGNIIYAGIIGALTGGVMEVGGIATSQRQVLVNKTGEYISLKEAKERGLKKGDYKLINKFTSSMLSDYAANIQEKSESLSEVQKLKAKYGAKTNAELMRNHGKEYITAAEKDRANYTKKVELATKLGALMETIGIKNFMDGVNTLNEMAEKRARMGQNFANNETNVKTKAYREFSMSHPGFNVSSPYSKADLTNDERFLAKRLEEVYPGKQVFFVDYGSNNQYSIQDINQTENFVFIQKDSISDATVMEVFENQVKGQLINNLMATPGLFTSKDYAKILRAVMPNDLKGGELTESVKRALINNVVFSEFTTDSIFKADVSIFSKIFRWFSNQIKKLKSLKNKNDIKQYEYSTLLKLRHRYLKIAAKNIGNDKDVENLQRICDLTVEDVDMIKDDIRSNYITKFTIATKIRMNSNAINRQGAELTLYDNIKKQFKNDRGIDYKRLLDPEYYTNEFVEMCMDAKPDASPQDAIWYYMNEMYNVCLSPINECIYDNLDLMQYINDDFYTTLNNVTMGIESPDEMKQYDRVDKLFVPEFNKKFVGIEDFDIEYSDTMNGNNRKSGETDFNTKTIRINKKTILDGSIDYVLLHEVAHALSCVQGLPVGTSKTQTIKLFYNNPRGFTWMEVDRLASQLFTEEAIDELYAKGYDAVFDKLAQEIYRLSKGELYALGDSAAFSALEDSFTIYDDGRVKGTGKFSWVDKFIPGYVPVISSEEDVVVTRTFKQLFKDHGIKSVSDLNKLGFNPEVRDKILSKQIRASELKALLFEGSIGKPGATNLIIDLFYPNNTGIKSIKDVDYFRVYFPMMYVALEHMKKNNPDFDNNKTYSYDEILDYYTKNETKKIKIRDKEYSLRSIASGYSSDILDFGPRAMKVLLEQDTNSSYASLTDFYKTAKNETVGFMKKEGEVSDIYVKTDERDGDSVGYVTDKMDFENWKQSELDLDTAKESIEKRKERIEKRIYKDISDFITFSGKTTLSFGKIISELLDIKSKYEAIYKNKFELTLDWLVDLFETEVTDAVFLRALKKIENNTSFFKEIIPNYDYKTFKNALENKMKETNPDYVLKDRKQFRDEIDRIKKQLSKYELTKKEQVVLELSLTDFEVNEYTEYIDRLNDILEKKQNVPRETKKEKERLDDFSDLQKRSVELLDELEHSAETRREIDNETRERYIRSVQKRLEADRNSNTNINEFVVKNDNKGTTFKMYSNVSPELFHDAFQTIKPYVKQNELVDLHDDYSGYSCYLSEDGMQGFAVSKDGNLVSVFNADDNKRGYVEAAKQLILDAGANHLDCYGYLAKYYNKVLGFDVASIMDYNMEYDHHNIAERYDNPSVAFMVLANNVQEKHFNKDQYDDAVDYQLSYLKEKTIEQDKPKKTEKEETEELIAKNTPSESDKSTNSLAQEFINIVERHGVVTEKDVQLLEIDSSTKLSISKKLVASYSTTFLMITDDNYAEIRKALEKNTDENAQRALVLFDYFAFKNQFVFDDKVRYEINRNYEKAKSLAGTSLAFQSILVKEYSPVSDMVNDLREGGLKVNISSDILAEYDKKLADKEAYIKELTAQMEQLKNDIRNATNDNDKMTAAEELRKVSEKKVIIKEGKPEAILDMLVRECGSVEEASKLVTSVTKALLKAASMDPEYDKKNAFVAFYNSKTGEPVSFPKARQIITKAWKKCNDFRMWAMLSSPVTYFRNALGNAGMTAQDKAVNLLERIFTKAFTSGYNTKNFAEMEEKRTQLNREKSKILAENPEYVEDKKELADALDKKRKTPESTDTTLLDNRIKLLSDKVNNSKAHKEIADIDAEINAINFEAEQLNYVPESKVADEFLNNIKKKYGDYIEQILDGTAGKYEEDKLSTAKRVSKGKQLEIKMKQAKGFKQILYAAQFYEYWGLESGPLGDRRALYNSLIKNFSNLVASNNEFILYDIEKRLKTEKNPKKVDILNKALQTKDNMDILNAMSDEMLVRFFDIANKKTSEQYFKNSNKFSKWTNELGKKNPMMGMLMSVVVAFPKVSYNILKMAYKISPLNWISYVNQLSIYQQKKSGKIANLNITGTERADLIRTASEATMGTVLYIAGVIAAALGWVDVDEDDYLGPAVNLGNIRIGLSDLAPSMTTFSTAAAMMWAWKNNKNVVGEALNTLYDNTLLGNIDNIFRYGSLENSISNLSISYIGQYIPAILKLMNKYITNSASKDKSGPYLTKLARTLGSYIPGVSALVPNKINPYTGEKAYSTGTDSVLWNLIFASTPLTKKYVGLSDIEQEAESIGAKTTGLSGSFTVNGKDYTIGNKESYAKYRAEYINSEFDKIKSGKKLVTVKNNNGKYITTKYEKLTEEQKENVLENLYSKASEITKIKWWISQGNKYVVTDKTQYDEYKRLLNSSNIVYKDNWNKSKFVEK